MKDRAHKKARVTRLNTWKQEFRLHCSAYKNLYKRDYSAYLESVEISATREPAIFW